jgi:probable O-glycosylation ligase (exosortase A-associated)
MQSLFLTAVFSSLIFMGFSAAFAAALGFVWVDIVKPQQLAYAIINGLPLSMISAIATMALFFLKDKKFAPRFGLIMALIAAFAVWVTFTTAMSDFPVRAWGKWDWASRVLIFALIFPYIFRSRVQIEAFILVFIFSASTIFFSAGLKTMMGGGGYGVLAIMGSGNTGLAESSTLAVVCVMLIPLILFIMRHTLLLPKGKLTNLFLIGVIVTALAAVVGTAARTGVIAICVLFGISVLRSKHRLWWITGAAVVVVVLMNIDLSATPWGARMSTIETYNADSSALGRLAVWKWTLEFVGSHPFGGGFDAYAHNHIASVASDGVIWYLPEGQIGGKAFHSIYFEVLGEQGIPGFIIYYSIVLLTLFKLFKLNRKWRKREGTEWFADLTNALMAAILIFLAGGAFVGIAYQPFIFYMISLTVALDAYATRMERDEFEAKGRVTR